METRGKKQLISSSCNAPSIKHFLHHLCFKRQQVPHPGPVLLLLTGSGEKHTKKAVCIELPVQFALNVHEGF